MAGKRRKNKVQQQKFIFFIYTSLQFNYKNSYQNFIPVSTNCWSREGRYSSKNIWFGVGGMNTAGRWEERLEGFDYFQNLRFPSISFWSYILWNSINPAFPPLPSPSAYIHPLPSLKTNQEQGVNLSGFKFPTLSLKVGC